MNRIKYLDGFRGLAIILVILYHAFARWTEIVPYGNQFSGFFLFGSGWLGVQLFFLISGFVILMTLDKSISFRNFIVKRWLRLFPAMLIATILIYFTASFFYERPPGLPHLVDIIPGLLFIEPYWLTKISHVVQSSLEGAFWSLFVEVKFYFILGISYFLVGRKKALGIIIFLFILALGLCMIREIFPSEVLTYLKTLLTKEFSFNHFGWFACGSVMYLYFKEQKPSLVILASAIGILSIITMVFTYPVTYADLIVSSVISILFITVICFRALQKPFENKLLLFIGFISYPLYLIHENAMVSMIAKMGRLFPSIPGILLPVIPILILVFIAFIIVKYLEPPLKRLLKRALKA